MNKQVKQIRAEVELRLNEITIKAWETRPRLRGKRRAYLDVLGIIDSQPEEQQEISLERFTEKMNSWKARFNRSDAIPVKGTMAFTARMFYMYPNVARLWYYSLPKATQD